MTHDDQEFNSGIRERFFALQTSEDVANLLGISHKKMMYLLYARPAETRYRTFYIPKRSGGSRCILAPCVGLKEIQQRLNQILQAVYEPRKYVHGFTKAKSIVTNARMHRRQRYVLNLDIKDFFPSINFGRVRGMFMAYPYSIGASAATILAQICCYDNQLPQGAPTSPVVSNMLCAKMDSQLLRLAQRHRCLYTRYADDLTFSTSTSQFPKALALVDEQGKTVVGASLEKIVNTNGFAVNPNKTRLQFKNGRQEVTGLTVNQFPNVSRSFLRQIRAMLHAWEKYGLEDAEKEFHSRWYKKHRNPRRKPPSFEKVVIGKVAFVGMVRGRDDSYYKLFRRQLAHLVPGYPASEEDTEDTASGLHARVYTEGKSDWKHLKAALAHFHAEGEFEDLNLVLDENSSCGGGDKLLSQIKTSADLHNESVIIGVFDRDQPKIMKEIIEDDCNSRRWSDKVCSVALPVPAHRCESDNICIEMYYQDDEIKRTDSDGRRLFLSTEFSERSGRYVDKEIDLNCYDRNKAGKCPAVIIDNDVFDGDDSNFALPKDQFATYVLNQEVGFDDFDFSAYKKLFELLRDLIRGAQAP